MLREEENIINAIMYLRAFSKISGLHCNMSKTKIIPVGNYDMQNKLCPDFKLDWESDFTLLGFYIGKTGKAMNQPGQYTQESNCPYSQMESLQSVCPWKNNNS